MSTLTCPKCQKNSYSSAEEFFLACPYCGFKFSGKHGPDRRNEERVRQEISFDFPCQEQYFRASTIDLSEKGLSVNVNIYGEIPVTAGETIDLSVGDLQIKAKVIWVNKLLNKSMVGLQKLN